MIEISVKNNYPILEAKMEAAIGSFVRKGAAYIDGQLKTSMAEPKSGKRYGDHVASAPGQSPAVDSGNFIGSITMIFPSTLEAKIGTPVVYAAFLEEGTSRMAQRPLWEKTATESLPTLENILNAEIGGIQRQ